MKNFPLKMKVNMKTYLDRLRGCILTKRVSFSFVQALVNELPALLVALIQSTFLDLRF